MEEQNTGSLSWGFRIKNYGLIKLVIVYVNILSLFKFKELVFFSSRYKIYLLKITIIQ